MDIITVPKAYPSESVDSSTTGTSARCDDQRRSNSSNSDNDNEASSSCNFRPVKRRRMNRGKVSRTTMPVQEDSPVVFREWLEVDPLEYDWEKLSPEESIIQSFALTLHCNKPSKQLFDAAAEMLKATPEIKKSLSECFFSGAECEIITKKLREQHNISTSYLEVRSILNTSYYAFEEYCLLMKTGREGLHFDRETGKVSIQGTYNKDAPIVDKLANINFSHTDAILNFNSLRVIFPFLWDKYFKDGSKKSSRSLYAASKSKRSRDTDSSESLKSFSSVHPNSNTIGQVINRIRELFGNGPDKHIPKAYVDAAKIHYGADENEGIYFLAYNDNDAKEDFASKANIGI